MKQDKTAKRQRLDKIGQEDEKFRERKEMVDKWQARYDSLKSRGAGFFERKNVLKKLIGLKAQLYTKEGV